MNFVSWGIYLVRQFAMNLTSLGMFCVAFLYVIQNQPLLGVLCLIAGLLAAILDKLDNIKPMVIHNANVNVKNVHEEQA